MRVHRLLRIWWRVACWGLGSFLFVSSAAAQANSGINGRVTDSTAGALPGATVTITSPALQVPTLTTITESDGSYRFLDLPAGSFEMRFELPGFRTAIRQDVTLTVGFIATINMALQVGGVAENITVSGASPVVDTTNTKVSSTLSGEKMSTIPNGRRPNDIAMMTPGMMLSTMPIATSLGLSGFSNTVSSGGISNYRIQSEGVEHNSGGIRTPDVANVMEINVTQSGGTADVAQAGTYVNLVSKSGGNEYHGRYAALGTGKTLQGSNIDNALRRQGINTLDSTNYFWDINGDLGGRIVRDKLWFYGSIRDRRNKVSKLGLLLNPGPDGVYGTGDDVPWYPTATNRIMNGKLTYQATSKYQLSWYYNHEANVDNSAHAGRFQPYEATSILRYSPMISKGELNATLTNRLLLTGMFARDWAGPNYFQQPGRELVPATLDLATQYRLGRDFPEDKRFRSKWQSKAEMVYLPAKAHELKVGMRTWSASIDTSHLNEPGGNYILVFDTINRVPHQPSQIRLYNSPVSPHSPSSAQSAYVTDRWSIGSQLTLNLGFRWDRYHAWVPPQTKVQGPFGNAGTFPAVEVGTWNRPAPRAGFAYNLGGGKTVIKGTYGWFNDDMAEDFSSIYNQNVDVIYTYRWHDLKGDNNYAPGDVNLDPNGSDFLGVSGAPNNIVNTHLKYPHTHELTGSLERELAPGLGLRVLYIYRKLADQVTISNVLRPYTAYSIPLTRRDPGPDGIVNTVDDGPMVTIWDYSAAYRGAAFVGNERVNYPSNRRDYFHTLEVTLNKRFSKRWDATVSGSAVKNHASMLTTANGEKTTTAGATTTSSAVPQSPNDLYFPLNETWDWTARTTTSYVLPFNIRVAALAFFESGAAGQRTYIFRAIDPLGGPPLVQQATVTLPLEPYGAHRGPVRDQVNVRFTKLMRLSHGRTVELNADVNNIINSNAAWSSTYQSGPTFGYATNVLPPRLLQFGAAFEF